MAGVKISNLPVIPSSQSADVGPFVQGGVTYQASLAQLATLFSTSIIGFLPLAGGTMLGNLILNADATLPKQAVTFEQFQTVAAGFTVILACRLATTGALTVTQAGAGPGATLTNASALVALSIDSTPVVLGDRILVKDQLLPKQNGAYTVTNVGSGAVAWVLTRAADYDQAPTEVKAGTLVAINAGTVNATTSWLETATVVTVDTDPILFSQFSFAPTAFLKIVNNLLDLSSVPAALVNLGLGVPTGTGNVVRQTLPTIITPNIVGVTNGLPAAAGSVGEIIESIVLSSSAVFIPNTLSPGTDVTSILLTPGDWLVYGNANVLNSADTAVTTFVWINTVSATPPDRAFYSGESIIATANFKAWNAPIRRINVSVNTTVYLSALAQYTSGSSDVCGHLFAIRVR